LVTKGIAFTDEIDRRFELLALADRRYLFTEDLFASRRLQVAKLSIRPGLLFQGA
jgi:hypothetical protein